MTNINIKTGNPIVDAVSKMNFTGNITPEIWYHTIVNDKGKPDLLSITILSDIVYWYHPAEVRSEDGLLLSYKKKFDADDFLQRSYDQIATKLNVSKRQAKDAIVLLEGLGIIKRHFRSVQTPNGILSNVMYIELIPERLMDLTYPDTPMTENVQTYDEISSHLCTNSDRPMTKNEHTYTENTTEITTENTTTTINNSAPVVDDEIREIFHGLNLPDKDIRSICSAANWDIEKCKNAVHLLAQQNTRINNITGWLIKAVKENYAPVSRVPVSHVPVDHAPMSPTSMKKNAFMNFDQRDYDAEFFDQLEKKLVFSRRRE